MLVSPADLYPPQGGAPAYRLLDVRAPVEVAGGALPGAVNVPILTDEERHLVGIRYKEAGQEAAIRLGHELTQADMPNRVARWLEVCSQSPTAVTCWRGGLRSKMALERIDRADTVRVAGGYKALRAFLMSELEPAVARTTPLVVAGLTGSGKTALLQEINHPEVLALDLEAEAAHRGSTFGGTPRPQPSQATFENSLAVKLVLSDKRVLLLEDESRNIGCRQLPDPLFEAIGQGPLLMVEESLESRVRQIHRDYILELTQAWGVAHTKEMVQGSLKRLRKRLGNETVGRLHKEVEEAARVGAWFDPAAHYPWISRLLEDYYDPLYRKGLERSNRPIAFRGTREECLAWLRQRTTP